MSITSRSLRRHQDINAMVHNVMPPSGLRLRLRRSLDHAKRGKLQQHGNWGIYHFAFSIFPQDYGFDKQYVNWIVRGPPEHHGLQITCNVIIMHIYITLLYSCWYLTLLQEHNHITGILECDIPVYLWKVSRTRIKYSVLYTYRGISLLRSSYSS